MINRSLYLMKERMSSGVDTGMEELYSLKSTHPASEIVNFGPISPLSLPWPSMHGNKF